MRYAVLLLSLGILIPLNSKAQRAFPSFEVGHSLKRSSCEAPTGPAAIMSVAPEIWVPEPSVSRGFPFRRGRLIRGVFLQESSTLRHVDADVPRGNFYGTTDLVALIHRASEFVESKMPGSVLSVGELAQLGGGKIVGHKSHQNGRDVDLGFYLKDSAGVPLHAPHFVRVGRSGIGKYEEETIYFDDLRNWFLVEALLKDEVVVQHVFVGRGIRKRLMRTAKKLGASAETLTRLTKVVMPPNVDHPHYNHFHVRIFCDENSARFSNCSDKTPFWPWLPANHPHLNQED